MEKLEGKPVGKCKRKKSGELVPCTMMTMALHGGAFTLPFMFADGAKPGPVLTVPGKGRGAARRATQNLFLRLCPWCGEKVGTT